MTFTLKPLLSYLADIRTFILKISKYSFICISLYYLFNYKLYSITFNLSYLRSNVQIQILSSISMKIIKTIYNFILRNKGPSISIIIIISIGTMLAIYYDKSNLPRNITALQIFEQNLVTLDLLLYSGSTINPHRTGMVIDQLFYLIKRDQSIEQIISFMQNTGIIISDINLQKMLKIILEHKIHNNGLPIEPTLLQKTQILHDTLTERLFGPTSPPSIVNIPRVTKSILFLGTIITCTLIVFKLIHE